MHFTAKGRLHQRGGPFFYHTICISISQGTESAFVKTPVWPCAISTGEKKASSTLNACADRLGRWRNTGVELSPSS